MFFFFFFSSRRRHTRSLRDWSSDVCSSDLAILELQRAALTDEDRVLLVDDWAERGSQALAARDLIADCGAGYVGLSLLVDQLPDEIRERLRPVAAVVTHAELPPST